MFENIGEKIKMVAVISFLLGALASIIAAIVLFVLKLVGIGFLVLIGGPIASWLSCIALYGFGELIVATSCNNAALVEIHTKLYTLERIVEKIAKQSTHTNYSTTQKAPLKPQTTKAVQPVIEKPITEQPIVSQPETTTADTATPAPVNTPTPDTSSNNIDAEKEQLYLFGVQMYERRSYQVAYNIFTKIPDYKNAIEYIEEIAPLL